MLIAVTRFINSRLLATVDGIEQRPVAPASDLAFTSAPPLSNMISNYFLHELTSKQALSSIDLGVFTPDIVLLHMLAHLMSERARWHGPTMTVSGVVIIDELLAETFVIANGPSAYLPFVVSPAIRNNQKVFRATRPLGLRHWYRRVLSILLVNFISLTRRDTRRHRS